MSRVLGGCGANKAAKMYSARALLNFRQGSLTQLLKRLPMKLQAIVSESLSAAASAASLFRAAL